LKNKPLEVDRQYEIIPVIAIEDIMPVIEALKFYANRSAWVKTQRDGDCILARGDNDRDELIGYFGGKRAREALATLLP
jgi:hypothetical protein